jgi:hypothetical protein
MRKLWKGVLLGAAAGGAVKLVLEVRDNEPLEEVGPAIAKAAGEAALVGAAVGLVLDRRERRRRSKLQRFRSKASLSGLAAAGALADAAQSAAQLAKPHLESAAQAAMPKLAAAAEAAKPHVEHAAGRAKAQAQAAAELAKPRIKAAGEAAKAKLSELDMPVLVAV